jgi:outer membrane protein assembly factor BamB
MKFPFCVTRKKHSASFRIVSLMLAIAPLWLMLATANTSAHAQTTSSPADWTQFMRDNMQRWNPYETVLGVGNVGNLGLKWWYHLQTLAFVQISPPAVVNGVVYFGSDDNLGDGNAYALNASTGTLIWKYPTGAMGNSPAVANGVVYFAATFGTVYALNAGTGAKLWSHTTEALVESNPVVVNGIIYFGCGFNVCALNASTGAQLWSFATGGFVGDPAVANGVVYVGSNDGSAYALNASTGAKLWSFYPQVGQAHDAAVANGVVYFGISNFVYALNASTGVPLWSYRAVTEVDHSPAVANGVVYVGDEGSDVYALDASTGGLLWHYAPENAVQSSPAVANGMVYVNTNDGNIYALNASTGSKLWSFAVSMDGTGNRSSPAIVDGVVYVGGSEPSGNGNLYAFALGGQAGADLFLRIQPTPTTVHQGDLLTFAFPVWNLGPAVAEGEVLANLQVPAGTTFDYVRISGTPGLGKCTTPPYGGTGQIICHEGDGMAPNTTWTVRLTVKVTAPAGTVITESAATMADTPDPNLANNVARVSVKVQ